MATYEIKWNDDYIKFTLENCDRTDPDERVEEIHFMSDDIACLQDEGCIDDYVTIIEI